MKLQNCNCFVISVVMLVFGTSCITSKEALATNPRFERTVNAFEQLHAENRLPGISSFQSIDDLGGFELTERERSRPYYQTFVEIAGECHKVQCIYLDIKEQTVCWIFCLDAETPVLIGTVESRIGSRTWRRVLMPATKRSISD